MTPLKSDELMYDDFDELKDDTFQQISGHQKLSSEAHADLIEELSSK